MFHDFGHTVTPSGQVVPNVTYTTIDNAYVIMSNTSSMFSVFGNLAIIGFYFVYPDIRTTGRKLLVSLSVANFIMCVATILQTASFHSSMKGRPADRSVLCETAAFFAVFGNLATFLWTCAIGFYLFLCVTLRFIVVANRVSYLFHAFSWTMPAIVALAAGASDVYGYDDNYLRTRRRPVACWVSDRVTNKLDWQFVTIEGWALASYCACVLMYVVVSCSVRCQRRMKKIDREHVIEDMAIQTANNQLRYVSLIFVCLRIWGTLYFLCSYYASGKVRDVNEDWLLLFKALGDSSIGWANCLLFVVTVKPLRKRIGNWFRKICKGKVIVPEKWRPSIIVRHIKRKKVPSLDLSGVHLDFPGNEESSSIIDDDIIFERADEHTSKMIEI